VSGKVTGLVWELDIPHGHAWVLMSLADHAHHDGTKVFPGNALTAWKTGYSTSQVKRILRDLWKMYGLIEPVTKGGGANNAEYRICLENFKNHQKTPLGGRGIAMNPGHGEPGSSDPPPVGASTRARDDRNRHRESSRRDAGASPNYFSLFTEQAKAFGYEVTKEDRKELPGNLKAVAESNNDATMRRIVLRCLEARMRGYPLSPQRALNDGNHATSKPENQGEGATPERGVRSVAQRVDLRRYVPLLEKWDFTRPEDPPWTIRQDLGGTDDERQRNLTRIRSLVGQQKHELSEEAKRLQEENERLTAEILRGVV
jgi:hypothetical protein